MDIQILINRNIENEFTFSASRSSGPGGQNVNKVNTRIEIRFNIAGSSVLSVEEKEILLSRLSKRINSEGDLLMFSQSERSQLQNREKAKLRMLSIIAKALTIKPRRVPTKPTESSKAERLEKKRRRGGLKDSRKSVQDNFD